jgi:hypothetical protein
MERKQEQAAMAGQAMEGQSITSEQLSDVYTAGTIDGIMVHEDGKARIHQDGTVTELE